MPGCEGSTPHSANFQAGQKNTPSSAEVWLVCLDMSRYRGTGAYFATFIDTTPPTVTLDPITTQVSPSVSSLNITGTATDDLGTIAKVEYQLDSISGTWNLCTANDGAFNSTTEKFTCSLTGITDVNHIIYTRGTDSSGNVNTGDNITVVNLSDTVAPDKVVITNIGQISNVANKDYLSYYFTSQTPNIKGTSEANSRTVLSCSHRHR